MKSLKLKNYFLLGNNNSKKLIDYEGFKKQLENDEDIKDIKKRIIEDGFKFDGEVSPFLLDEIIAFLQQTHIETLQDWLQKKMLHGPVSRARTRFLKLLDERVREIEAERKRLAEDNAKKNKDGELLYLDDKGKETIEIKKSVQYAIKDAKKFNQDFTLFINEDYVIDVSPERVDTIYGVRELILNTDDQFTGAMANRYELWCSAFENIKEAEEVKEEKKDEKKNP